MPGERQLLEQFAAELQPRVLAQLVQVVFEKMKLAGEVGALLKIEEEIADAVAKTKRLWLSGPKLEQSRLFAEDTRPEQAELNFDFSGITDETFWEKAEERIYAELEAYAEEAANGHGYQRRLFAGDTARGFAFIEICRKRFDAVLMNPPFGEATKTIYQQDTEATAGSSREIASLFLSRSTRLLKTAGRIGMLASRLVMFLDQLEEWRKATLEHWNFSLVADLGYGVLDAVIEPAAFVVASEHSRIGTFFRLLSATDKEKSLKTAINMQGQYQENFTVVNSWDRIPGNRIAYWAPKHWLDLFAETTIQSFAKVSKGLETGEDERFLRLAVEVPPGQINHRWRRYAKGGEYQPIAGNYELVVDFNLLPVARRATDAESFGKAGVTYTQRTTSFLSFRALPSGAIFSPGGPGILAYRLDHNELLLSYLGSRPIGALVELCVGSGDSAVRGSAARNYTTGIIKSLPCLIDHISGPDKDLVRNTSRDRFQSVQRHQLGVDELSPTFVCIAVDPQLTLIQSARQQAKDFAIDAVQVLKNDWDIDQVWTRAFGFNPTDCEFLDRTFSRHPAQCGGGHIPEEFWQNSDSENKVEESTEPPLLGVSRQLMKRSHVIHAELESLALRFDCRIEDLSRNERFHESLVGTGNRFVESVFSYAVGVCFGRWDIRYATGQKAIPPLFDLFAALPSCPHGLLRNAGESASN